MRGRHESRPTYNTGAQAFVCGKEVYLIRLIIHVDQHKP